MNYIVKFLRSHIDQRDIISVVWHWYWTIIKNLFEIFYVGTRKFIKNNLSLSVIHGTLKHALNICYYGL